jgi:hypothetical protein
MTPKPSSASLPAKRKAIPCMFRLQNKDNNNIHTIMATITATANEKAENDKKIIASSSTASSLASVVSISKHKS